MKFFLGIDTEDGDGRRRVAWRWVLAVMLAAVVVSVMLGALIAGVILGFDTFRIRS